ncbi:MAG: DUF1036 domain-containing protein [Alphaproteobacteria bacterium]|nr:DUF1036 domain-containing protein [Alphaproteobacteria bacterium]
MGWVKAALRAGMLSLILAGSMVPAHATLNHPQICNGTNVLVAVAIAWWGRDSPGLHSRGWYNIQPGQCRALFPEDSYSYHRYVFAYNEYDPAHPDLSRAWSDGPPSSDGWCVGAGASALDFSSGSGGGARSFEYQNAMGPCESNDIKRGFLQMPSASDPTGVFGDDLEVDYDFTLTWDNARPGSLIW